MVEELAARIKARAGGRIPPAWLDRRAAIAAASLLVFTGGVLVWRSSRPFGRKHLSFPSLPKLNSGIVSAQEKLKADPQDLDALVKLGTLHFEKGKEYYADAINELEDARRLGAMDPRIFYCLGIMYQEVGLYAFALEEYQKFLRHYPDDKEIRLLSGKLLYKQGLFKEAVSEYERLKYHYPKDPLIEENLGLSLWGAKDLDRAVESFTNMSATSGAPGLRAQFYLAQIAMERSDWQRALTHLEKCPPGEKDFGVPKEKLLTAMAQTRQKLGQWVEAKAAWEAVVAHSPNDSKAKSSLREVTRRIPAPKKAKKS